MKRKKKNSIISATADMVGSGISLGVGSLAVGSIAGTTSNANVQRIAGMTQSGFRIAAAGIPVRGGYALLDEFRKMGKKAKK